MELAARCLKIEEEVATKETRIIEIDAACAFSDSDDDGERRAEIATLRGEIEALRAEQGYCSSRMSARPNLADVAAANAGRKGKP